MKDLSGEAVRRAANGDAAAWEPLVRAHQEAVFRLCYLLLGDPDEAEDVAQETFLRAWKHLRRFDATRPLRPWLLSIASNLASNRSAAARGTSAASVAATTATDVANRRIRTPPLTRSVRFVAATGVPRRRPGTDQRAATNPAQIRDGGSRASRRRRRVP